VLKVEHAVRVKEQSTLQKTRQIRGLRLESETVLHINVSRMIQCYSTKFHFGMSNHKWDTHAVHSTTTKSSSQADRLDSSLNCCTSRPVSTGCWDDCFQPRSSRRRALA